MTRACSGLMVRLRGRGAGLSEVCERISGERAFARRALHQRQRAVRDVDDDAELVAAAYDLGAEVGQAVVHRRRGLDVAQLVDAVVRELQVTQVMVSPRLVDAIDLPFEKIGALGRYDDRWRPGARGAERGDVRDHAQRLALDQFAHAAELDLRQRRRARPGQASGRPRCDDRASRAWRRCRRRSRGR